MIFTIDYTDLVWIIGLGISFGLGFAFSYLTDTGIKGFLVFFMIMIGFAVWTGLLPLWSLVSLIITTVMLVYLQLRGKNQA